MSQHFQQSKIPLWLRLVQTRAAKGFAVLSILFLLFLIPIQRIAAHESELVSPLHTHTLPLLGQSLTTRRNRVRLKVAYPHGNSYEEEARFDHYEEEAWNNACDTFVNTPRSRPHTLLAMIL
jgi:hypothetical protein